MFISDPILPYDMEGFEVVRAGTLFKGASTLGILRERAFDAGDVIFSKSTVDGGTISDWHHHGTRRLFGYVVSGTLRLEFSASEASQVSSGDFFQVSSGDFFQVSPGKVHRDVNPSHDEPAVIVNLLVGEGPAVVNVPGPEAKG